MKQLSKYDKEFLVECIQNGKEIPEEYKYALFPTKQREYELVYAGKTRKEDILADNEEAKAVPLQVEKVFNGKNHPLNSKDWQNILVFGDNLQFLKTCYRNQDPLIKGKVKGKVKLIYIDPPFASKTDFSISKNSRSYLDDRRAAEFVEWLRRRLFLMREILADNGSIFLHLDWKKSHYIKLVMDEVFGENNFRNEISWYYTNKIPDTRKRQFTNSTDSILFYTKGRDNYFKHLETMRDIPIKVSRMKKLNGKKIYLKDKHGKGIYEERTTRTMDNIWNIPLLHAQAERVDYPTQKPEELLRRIIECSTEKGDLVMDVFVGSGTTLAVAEKLDRRWIGCDIGKLSIYTIQKRLLTVANSKDLDNKKGKHGKDAKVFCVATAGLYDLGKIFKQVKDRYIEFVSQLFEVEKLENKKIGGIEIDGKRGEFYVKIFPYWEFKDANVDEGYIEDLHRNIGKKIDERFYIIAPANSVDFISDYHAIDNVQYYFLKVPYQIIKELHKVQFKKLRQPQSKRNVNDLEDAIGFHFIRQPEVKSKIEKRKDRIIFKITKFYSQYVEEESQKELDNFESLAMVLVDLKYNSKTFLMSDYFFAEDFITDKKKQNIEDVEFENGPEKGVDAAKIRNALRGQKEIKLEFEKKDCGKEIMAVYVDIYGNEFREILKV